MGFTRLIVVVHTNNEPFLCLPISTHLGTISATMVILQMVYLCIWDLVPYASASTQNSDMDPAIPSSNFNMYGGPLFKGYQNIKSRGSRPRRKLAGQCSSNLYNKPFFVSDDI